MSGKSDYLENKFMDWFFRGQSLSAPATVYVALFTSAANDAGGGGEPSSGAYARVAVASSLANWSGTQSAGSTAASSGTSGQISNNNAVTFPAPSGANWGVLTYFGIFDASTSGNLLYWGQLTTPKTVNDGDSAPVFAAGTLTITEG